MPLPGTRAYLHKSGDSRDARALVETVATELALVAGRECRKKVANRLPVTVVPTDDRPMFSMMPSGRSLIRLSRSALDGDFRSQVVYQLAHEAHHLACAPWPAPTSDVALEMLATTFAVRIMKRVNPVYARRVRERLVDASERLTTDGLLRERAAANGADLGVAFYGRAYVLGRRLEQRFGRREVAALAGLSSMQDGGDPGRRLRRLVGAMR